MSSTIAALPFFSGEMDSFDPLDSSIEEDTSTGKFDTTKSRCCIKVPAFTNGATSVKWPEASTLWTSVYLEMTGTAASGTAGSTMFAWLSDAGVTVGQLRIYGSITLSVDVYSLQGGVMTLVGSTTVVGGVPQRFDFKWVAGASGAVSLYIANTPIWAVTGLNHAGWTGIAQYKLLGGDGIGGAGWHSQIIAKATSTISNYVITDNIDTESGAPNNAWTGGVSDINEIVFDDSLFIYTGVANDVSTFYDSTLDLTGYSILGRGVGARMRVQDAGPTQRQLVLESGGTNYFSTSVALDVGMQGNFNSWVTNPAGGAWTAADAAATKGGVKAIA